MVTRRQRRINELLMQELSMLVPGRVDDPRLETVVVTHVESTQDLSAAKVYFTTSAPADEDALADIHEGLEQARGFLRGELAGLGLRRMPRLVFARDRDYESGARVLDLLEQISSTSVDAPADDAPPDGDANVSPGHSPSDAPGPSDGG